MLDIVLALSLVWTALLGNTPLEAASQAAPLTYTKDIAPILFDNCAACHRPGGSAPFSVLAYASVRQRATLIAEVTARGVMPPWKSEPGYGDFVGQHKLSASQIGEIREWVDHGAPEGRPEDLPPIPQWTEGWRLGQPDLIVELARPYLLRADGPDEFREFTIRIPIKTARYVRGLEFRPGNRVVHHADFALGRAPTAREQEQNPGMLGMNDSGFFSRVAEEPAGQLLGWTAGQGDSLLPKGLAWRLDPGTDLVVQMHMHPSGKPETVQVSIGLYFTDEPPAGMLTRIRLGREDLDIPAGAKAYSITDSYRLPVDVDVLAVKPHAHFLAREMKGFAVLPNGAVKWLIYIKDWDFAWQNMYRYETPLALPAGTTLVMQYAYDNSVDNVHNPSQPPRRVRWGPETSDEMGDLWVQVMTHTRGDLETLNREMDRKMLEESVAGYEMLIERAPLDVGLRNAAAFRYLELERPKEAVTHFGAVAQVSPGLASAHFNLGTAMRLANRTMDAEREFRAAVRINRDFAAAHFSLAGLLLERNELSEALAEYFETIRVQPAHSAARNNAGFLLAQQGRLDEAVTQLNEALRLDPQSPDARYNLGLVFERQAHLDLAIDAFRRALELKPGWPPVLVDLAWVLATAPDERLRDARQALALAERASSLAGGSNPEVLDVLAAAYAGAGRFDDAVRTIEQAIQLAPGASTAAAMRARAELYKRHLPYRESPRSN